MTSWGYPTAEHLERIAERRGRVAAMTRIGMSATEIAAALRVTTRTVYRDRTAAGVSRSNYPSLTDDQLRRVEELLDDGCSIAEAARTIGRGYTNLRCRFAGRGWTRQQIGDHMAAVRQWGALT